MLPRLLSRDYPSDARPFSVVTEDGVRLVGTRIGTGPALVLCHGFLGWHRKPSVVRFARLLAAWFTVYAFDTRGHGRSDGRSTFGDREFLDVDAVVRLARRDRAGRIATVGASMGGIAVVRHAAYRGTIDAVMAISTPARWEGHASDAVRRMRLITANPVGRRVARGFGVRLADTWSWPEDPENVVADIAPTPLLLVHGADDHYFDVEDAWRLYRRAREPKRLMLADRFGHAEDGFTPAFADLAARRLLDAMGA